MMAWWIGATARRVTAARILRCTGRMWGWCSILRCTGSLLTGWRRHEFWLRVGSLHRISSLAYLGACLSVGNGLAFVLSGLVRPSAPVLQGSALPYRHCFAGPCSTQDRSEERRVGKEC